MTSIEMARAWLRAGTGVALAVAAACTAGCMTVGADFVAPPAPDAPAYRHAAQGSSNPAAARRGPTVSWSRGPIRWASEPDAAENTNINAVAGSSATPARNADQPAATCSS